MERYDSYKPSGISWICEIPSHWEVLRLKNLFLGFSNGTTLNQIRNGETDYPVTRIETISKGVINKEKVGYVEYSPILEKYLLNPGDILISHINSFERIGNSALVHYSDTPIYHGMNLLRLVPQKSTNSNFSFLFFQCHYFLGDMQRRCKPAINQVSVSSAKIKDIQIPIPPLDEQKKIVEFLSTKTSLIDAQQRERERELRLLDELKQAEIANVVTRGLNPDVPMRDTNIPWLDKVPAHWEEKRAKYLFIKQNRPVREEDEVITCFRDGQVTLRKNRRTEGFTESFKEIGYQGIRKGDLVIHQMDAFAGSSGVSDSDGKSTPVYIVCTPAYEYIYIPYFALVFRRMGLNGFIQSLYRGIRERSSNFSYDVFCNQILPIPPIEEQKAIVEYIQQKNAAIDEMIANLRAEIDFLIEYKQRLIADVVTGQLKVD